jgi:hypothetical protein
VGWLGRPGAQLEADMPEASRKASCMSAMELKGTARRVSRLIFPCL